MSRKTWLVAVILTAGALVSSAAPRLNNPSFEMVGDGDDRAEGWERWGDWMNRESGWSPTRDGECIIGYHHWQIEKEDDSGLWQDIQDVVPGKTYTFSIYANTDRSDDGRVDAESIELRLETTVDGEQSTVASQMYKVADLATGSDWSRLKVQGRVPANALRVVVVVTPGKGASRGGAIKLDDASLSQQ